MRRDVLVGRSSGTWWTYGVVEVVVVEVVVVVVVVEVDDDDWWWSVALVSPALEVVAGAGGGEVPVVTVCNIAARSS